MRRIRLIHNPAAARWSADRLKIITATLSENGCEVDVHQTAGPGDAVTLAAAGVADGVDAVAIFGGDGTMIQSVKGLNGSGIPIGVIPGGTGNLLAANLGLPRDVQQAATIVATGVARFIDLGQVDSATGRDYFAVASGAGFDAEIMSGTVGKSKRRWGQTAYVLETLRSLGTIRPNGYQLTIDGETHAVEAVTVLVANCKTILPPFFHLGRNIELDDGEFDILVLNARNAFQIFSAAFKLLSNRTDNVRVKRFRGKSIRIEADRRLPMQLDGDPSGFTPFEITMLAGALPVLVAGNGFAPAS